MKKKIYLVTSTRCKTLEEFQKRPLAKSLDRLYRLYDRSDFEFHILKDNQEGLSKAYNKFLTEEYKDCIVLFVHDDVIIRDLFLVEHLRKSPYTVTGLAGTSSFLPEAEKAAWHLMSHPSGHIGEVAHIRGSKIWTTVFGPTIGPAKIIDGVFIAINVEQIIQTQARFNEEFNWHHYDMAFSLECNKHNVSVGIMPVSIIHYGLGDSMLSADWEESSKKFKEVYCKN